MLMQINVRLPKSEFSADFGSDPEKARHGRGGSGSVGLVQAPPFAGLISVS